MKDLNIRMNKEGRKKGGRKGGGGPTKYAKINKRGGLLFGTPE